MSVWCRLRDARRRPNLQLAAAGLLALAMLASLVRAPYLDDQHLQQLPTVLAAGGLALAARRGWLSDVSALCLTAFFLLHVFAARWVYTMVPYERWVESLLGLDLRAELGWRRNHFDRLVHLAFGVLLTAPLGEVLRRAGTRPVAIGWLVTGLVLGGSAVYEVVEWLLTMTVAPPEMVERYNGQQGDAWDAQKDMALAGLGALLGWGLVAGIARFGRART